nr:immunoglobulin heavy chain junction region [Mus musculus]MBK4184172.1 immunoglobulin heavy chain junction region [Mus musculus]MBK4184173.1 immunoglobulin heavy chain junction region [Mus musculus]
CARDYGSRYVDYYAMDYW